ncbi:hypothetical protein CARUB_v10015704mg [Capsella rubella]|uniref:HAT C-terminal dimerisation domain-containing protein n=1 Tax=Capsella rubella TaxID=81985 RepID=R0I3B7_9BRAS|nr:hypothetical protein CARUB_v10015704mg [Capsella rubella]
MIEKALKYDCALNRFKVVDKKYKYFPSAQDWKRAKLIHEILMPFYKITTLMSRRRYSTSNLYFGHIWKIQCLLEVNRDHVDNVIREMVYELRLKYDKYLEQYNVVLAMGAVLDPRMKFKLLKRCYDELDLFTSQAKINHLKSELYKLFEEYRKKFPLTPFLPCLKSSDTGFFDLDDVLDYMEEGKSALDMYLEDPKLDMKSYPNLNVLRYWRENQHRFAALTYMAMDILSIPITTVASESSFNIG